MTLHFRFLGYNLTMSDLYDRLERRIERLQKFVRIRAPHTLITRELVLVIQTAFVLFPDFLMESVKNWLLPPNRAAHGLCPHCDRPLSARATHVSICEMCEAQQEGELRALEEGEDGNESY